MEGDFGGLGIITALNGKTSPGSKVRAEDPFETSAFKIANFDGSSKSPNSLLFPLFQTMDKAIRSPDRHNWRRGIATPRVNSD